MIQPHFDYACSAWYPNLTQNLSKKLQTTQNKWIRFCLQLGNRSHIGASEFKQINWFPINERFRQCVCSTIFKFFNNGCPAYMSEMFATYMQDSNTRNATLKLCQLFRKTNKGQKGLSYLGPSLWNKIDTQCKSIRNLNTFKHSIEISFFLINLWRKRLIFIGTDFENFSVYYSCLYVMYVVVFSSCNTL